MKFEDKTVKSTQPLLLLIRPPWLPDLFKPYGTCVKRGSGNRCSVSVFFAQVGSQISPRRAKKDSNIPSRGRTRSVKCPTPGPTKTIKSPSHALPTPPPALHWQVHKEVFTWHWGEFHPGASSLRFPLMALHLFSTLYHHKFQAGASHPSVSSLRFLYRGENFSPVRNRATVSCKHETTTHFGVKSVCR